MSTAVVALAFTAPAVSVARRGNSCSFSARRRTAVVLRRLRAASRVAATRRVLLPAALAPAADPSSPAEVLLPSQSAADSGANAAPTSPGIAVARDLRPRWAAYALAIMRTLAPLALLAGTIANPALAVPAVAARTVADQGGFIAGLTSSFLLVLASEIGDKTFFISALLSMKYSRTLVLIGTMLALASMTVISVLIGQVFHALPASLNSAIPFDDYAAAALLLWFGFQSLRDGLAMKNGGGDGELRDATEVVEEATGRALAGPTGVRVVTETSSLVFLAEWGDKSMLATVALAAAKSPLGVVVGGITGHLVASIIAVVGGSFLGRYVSERTAKLLGGVLFWVFALLTIFNVF